MSENTATAVTSAVHRLVAETVLSPAQGEAVMREFSAGYHPTAEPAEPAGPAASEPEASARSSALGEVGGYIGAAFVVAAVAALLGPNWEHFSPLAREGVLGGPALLLLLCGVALAAAMPGGWSLRPDTPVGPRRRLVGVLALTAGALLAGVAAVVAGPAGDRVIAPALLVCWLAGYALCRGHLLHLASGAALPWAVLAVVNPDWTVAGGRLTGALLVLAGTAWAALTIRNLVGERDLGLLVAGALAFGGSEALVATGPAAVGYLLLAVLAVLALAGYLRTRLISALVVGASAMAVVVPQAVVDYTAGLLGPAGLLLVCGLSFVAASTLSLRLRRSAVRP
jgi:hypothetical protein